MQRKWIFVFITSLALISISGCKNTFEDLIAKKTTDESIYFGAQMLMDKQDYTGAITEFQKLSASYLAKREVQMNYASAYAGRCGLDVVGFANTLSSDTSTNLFLLLMRKFSGITASRVEDCKTAETIVRAVADSADNRSADENVFLAFVSLAKIGAILALTADLDANSERDTGFDACLTTEPGGAAGDPHGLTNANVAEIGTALNLIQTSLAGPGVPTLFASMATSLDSACAALPTTPVDFQFCGNPPVYIDSAVIEASASFLAAIRGGIAIDAYPGLGGCAGSIETCCP